VLRISKLEPNDYTNQANTNAYQQHQMVLAANHRQNMNHKEYYNNIMMNRRQSVGLPPMDAPLQKQTFKSSADFHI
jgi:hypothetical protein